jgi:hypothetical protein
MCNPATEETEVAAQPYGGSRGSHHHQVTQPDGSCNAYQCYIHPTVCVNRQTGARRPGPDQHLIQFDLLVGPCP